MGQNHSKEDVDEAVTLQRIAENDGPEEVEKYIEKKMDKWKEQIVTIAITGETAVGKSTFINCLRGVQPGQPQFAKTGSGNTTTVPTMYENPKNRNVQFWDLPGVATLDFKMESYMSVMQLSKYDYFIIFFDSVLKENDLWLVQELNKLSKPFSLVRSKIDVDMNNAIYDGKSEEEILPEIRKKIDEALQKAKDLKSNNSIFLISSRFPHLGDMPELLNHMEQYLPSSKYEAILYSLPSLTEHFIESTYTKLKKRIPHVTFMASLCSIFLVWGEKRLLSKLTAEIKHYIFSFNLSLEKSESFQNYFSEKLSKESLKHCVGIKLSKIRTETTNSDILNEIQELSLIIGHSPRSVQSIFELLKWFLDLFKTEALATLRKERPVMNT